MKQTAILYLRAPGNVKDQQSVLVPQATALGRYVQDNNLEVMEVYYELEDADALKLPQRDTLVQAIFDRKVKPDFLLFTSLEVFGKDRDDALNLHCILSKYGVITKAILQPNIIFASLPQY